MKSTVIIATTATVIGAAAIAAYLLRRRKRNINVNTPIPVHSDRSHHLTNVFANAKRRISDTKAVDNNFIA